MLFQVCLIFSSFPEKNVRCPWQPRVDFWEGWGRRWADGGRRTLFWQIGVPLWLSEGISGSNGRHLLSDSVRRVSSRKPLIWGQSGSINGEEILHGSSGLMTVWTLFVYSADNKRDWWISLENKYLIQISLWAYKHNTCSFLWVFSNQRGFTSSCMHRDIGQREAN